MIRHSRKAAAAAMLVAAFATPGIAQSVFDGIPGLSHYGEADGWQVKKLDSDDIWYGQACVLYRELSGGPNPVSASYRFEPGEDEVNITFRFPYAQSVPDREAVDWGALDPTDFVYAVDEENVHEISGDVTLEYIDANTIYVDFSLDADAEAVERIASAEWVGVAVDGEQGLTFPTGRASRAVSLARRCLRSF